MKHRPPEIIGQIEISRNENGIFIGGDPAGLKSLAEQVAWLAEVDQERMPQLPDGERVHLHWHPGCQLTRNSEETEISRLDAKGAGLVHGRGSSGENSGG
ncbi:MAG: hypothetical protein WC708_17385 [Lentisphaeria bacterium]